MILCGGWACRPELRAPGRQGMGEHAADERLDSWKEIAAYLKRDESTVRWWEAEGLSGRSRHSDHRRCLANPISGIARKDKAPDAQTALRGENPALGDEQRLQGRSPHPPSHYEQQLSTLQPEPDLRETDGGGNGGRHPSGPSGHSARRSAPVVSTAAGDSRGHEEIALNN